ncbi:hypothetical protein D3C81_1894110 [compost metagenome]
MRVDVHNQVRVGQARELGADLVGGRAGIGTLVADQPLRIEHRPAQFTASLLQLLLRADRATAVPDVQHGLIAMRQHFIFAGGATGQVQAEQQANPDPVPKRMGFHDSLSGLWVRSRC